MENQAILRLAIETKDDLIEQLFRRKADLNTTK